MENNLTYKNSNNNHLLIKILIEKKIEIKI